MVRDAGSNQHGTINGRNHIKSANLPRVLRQLVASAGTMLCSYERMMRQFLQHLGHERGGDTIFLGNLIGATSMLLAMHSQVLDGNQAVVGFFGKLEHRSIDLPDARNMRLIQSQMKYIPGFSESQPKVIPYFHTSPVFLTTYNKTETVLYQLVFSEWSPAAVNGRKSELNCD